MRRSALRTALCLWLLLALCACAARNADSPALLPRTSVRVGDAVLDYRDLGGPGRPLLLITGYAVTMDMWDPVFVRQLAGDHRVILMDNRGMGTAKAPDGPISIGQMAQDAIGLLEALGIAKADVLGWSMGGIIAQEMALARPDLVGALALCGTMSDSSGLMPVLDRMAAMPPEELKRAMFPKAWAAANPKALSDLPGSARPPDPDVVARQYAALGQWRGTLRNLPDLRCPVLLLGGAEDWVSPPEKLQRMARAIPGARLELLIGAGHWMMHQYPQQMAQAVNEFLALSAAAQTAGAWSGFFGGLHPPRAPAHGLTLAAQGERPGSSRP